MTNLENFDTISLAKEMQFEIEFLDDPIEASLKATEALVTLRHTHDERLQQGQHLIIKAFGAYALKVWDEERGQHVSFQYDDLTADGKCAGIGFVQNMSGNLRLQTLFIALRDTSIEEKRFADSRIFANHTAVSKLVIPVLNIEKILQAA